MGWIWRDDDDDDNEKESHNFNSGHMPESPNPNPTDRFSTRRIVQTKCNTQEVEPGKFVRKCHKTEQILKDCLGKPTEIVQSNKEYTEEDVTDEVMKGSAALGSSDVRPFDFPGLRNDIEAIERSIFGSINRFFEAADEMRNGFFRMLDDPSILGGDSSSSSSSRSRVVPFEDIPQKPDTSANGSDSYGLDIPSLAKDV